MSIFRADRSPLEKENVCKMAEKNRRDDRRKVRPHSFNMNTIKKIMTTKGTFIRIDISLILQRVVQCISFIIFRKNHYALNSKSGRCHIERQVTINLQK